MSFKQRTSSPPVSDLNQIKTTYPNGRNHCMLINSTTGSVLPNCVAYCHFRWLELAQELGMNWSTIEEKMCRGNAENYWQYTQDGYSRGQEPKLGAIIVWRKGATFSQSDGAGHVAIVESINKDSNGNVIDITCSASNYGGTRWYRSTYKKSNNYYIGNSYTFLGFIYFPIEFEIEDRFIGTPVERNENVDQVEVTSDILNARKNPGGEKWGKFVKPGFYNVYSVTKTDEYTWYEIELVDTNKVEPLWAADVGLVYLPKIEDPSNWQAKYEELVLQRDALQAEVTTLNGKILEAVKVLS